jgi:hypothetical protein
VLRPIPDLPAGVIGFDAVGEVHSNDYRDVLRPQIDGAVGRGEVRLVYVLGDEFTGYSAGASWEDAKLGFEHHSAWVRTALVSDLDWVRHMTAAVGWLVPGELRHFPLTARAEAVQWAAGVPGSIVGEHPAGAPADEAPSTEPSVGGPIVSDEVPASPAIPTVAEPVVEPTTEPTAVVDPTAVFASHELPRYQTLTPTAPLNPNAEVRAGIVTGPSPSSPPTPPTPAVPAQWAADPHGRHQHRWWDGERWTAYVADNGVTVTDPFG